MKFCGVVCGGASVKTQATVLYLLRVQQPATASNEHDPHEREQLEWRCVDIEGLERLTVQQAAIGDARSLVVRLVFVESVWWDHFVARLHNEAGAVRLGVKIVPERILATGRLVENPT